MKCYMVQKFGTAIVCTSKGFNANFNKDKMNKGISLKRKRVKNCHGEEVVSMHIKAILERINPSMCGYFFVYLLIEITHLLQLNCIIITKLYKITLLHLI